MVDSVAGRLFGGSFVVLLIGLVFGFDVGSGLNFLDSFGSGKLWIGRNPELDCKMVGSLVCGIVDFGPALNGFGVDSVFRNFLDSDSSLKS